MPQVDLETLVSACAGVSCDRKIACETLASSTDNHHQQPQDSETDPAEIPPDFPPESFWLSKDAELDWFDRNAFIERKDSTKGNSHSANLNPNINPGNHPNPSSNSQRFANLKSKASIIGLPKPQKSCFVDAKNRRNCKPGNTHLFPKRSGSTGKSVSSLAEPSSPKVSCMGRVRSKKDRSRRLRNRHRSTKSTEQDVKKEKSERRQKSSFLASFRAIFTSSGKHTQKSHKDRSYGESAPRKSLMVKTNDIRDRLPARERDAPPRKSADTDGIEPVVGLGGMTRFASGRRSESWVGGVDVA